MIPASVIVRIREACARFADLPAIEDAAGVWTYAQLRDRMDAWAIKPGDEAYVFHEQPHGAEGVAALLGALACGRCVVPLDPKQPGMIRNEIRALVAQEGSPGLPGQGGFAPPCMGLLFFTSGSSGTPKGIAWPQRTLARAALNLQAMFEFVPGDRHALLSPLSVAATAAQVLAPLAAGATVCLFEARKHSSAELAAWIERENITTLQTVPSLFRSLAREVAGRRRFPKLRAIKLGGESVTSSDAKLFAEIASDDAVLINGLGLTEAGFNVCWRTWRAGEPLFDGPFPVGRAAPEVEIEVVETSDEVGEIVVRSSDLPDGYWRDAARTAEVYRDVPGRTGWRELRTRDAGRWDANGELVHLGRLDELVKIRGHRLDPAVVEIAALDLPGVTAAVAIAKPDGETTRLILFVEHSQSGSRSLTATQEVEIRRQLAGKLPDYAVPADVIVLEKFPRLAFGKIDRQALAKRSGDTPVAVSSREENGRQECRPSDALEQTLLALFSRALRRKRVGLSDSFFDLGGDSLAAAHLFSDIARVLRVELPLTELKSHPTVERLAARIRVGGWNLNDNPVALLTAYPEPDAINLFVWPGAGSDVMALCDLATALGPSVAFHAIQHRGADGRRTYDTSMKAIVNRSVELIRAIQPRGPYALCGSSFGGLIAVEVARRLRQSGDAEVLLTLLDTYGPGYPQPKKDLPVGRRLRRAIRNMKPLGRLDDPGFALVIRGLASRAIRMVARRLVTRPAPDAPIVGMTFRYLFLQEACFLALRSYAPQAYAGAARLFRCETRVPEELFERDDALGLRALISGPLTIEEIPGRHGQHLREPHVAALAVKLGAVLSAVRSAAQTEQVAPDSAAVWDELADWWDQAARDENPALFRHPPTSPLERLIEETSGAHVLDIACGNGWLSRRLARKGARVVAMDFSAKMIAGARARSDGLAIDYRQADATRLETFAALPVAEFDAALCNMALQDMASIDALFSGTFAALRPGGRFVLSFVHPRTEARKNAVPYEPTPAIALPGQPRPNIEVMRPLSDVLAAARSAGWVVEELQELPTVEAPLVAVLSLRRPA